MRKKRASRCSQKHIFQKTTFQRTKKRQRRSFWRDAFPPNSDRTHSHPTLTEHVPSHFATTTGKAKEETKKRLNVQERKSASRCSPEAHFPKDDISENKEKTKAQLLTRRVPTQLWQDTVPPNSDDTRSHPLRREDWKSQGTDKEKFECPRTKMCFLLQPEAHFWKTRT